MGDTTHMWVPEKGGPVAARQAEGVARDVGHPHCLDFVEERARRGIARVALDYHLQKSIPTHIRQLIRYISNSKG